MMTTDVELAMRELVELPFNETQFVFRFLAMFDIPKSTAAQLRQSHQTVWSFSPYKRTWLQTGSLQKGECHWYLTKDPDDKAVAAFRIKVLPSMQSVADVLMHVANKNVGDKSQLLGAILPAIRGIALLRE